MLNVSDEVKNLFLKDSTKKKLIIKVDKPENSDPSIFNFYSGNFPYKEYSTTIAQGTPLLVANFTNAVDMRIVDYVKYVRFSMGFRVHDIVTAPSKLTIRVNVQREYGTGYIDTEVTLADYTNNYHRVFCGVFNSENNNGFIEQITDVQIINTDSTAFVGTITHWDYQVDMVDNQSDLPTSYNTNFSKDVADLSDYMPLPSIENDNIELESFSMTESLCSQDNIRFGLCESAHCGFKTVGYNYNLKDRTIRPGIRVQGTPSVEDIEAINFWKDQSGIMTKGQTYTANGSVSDYSYLWTNNWLIDTILIDEYFSKAKYVYVGYKVKFTNMSVISGTTPVYFRGDVQTVYEDDSTSSWWEFDYHEMPTNDYVQVGIPVSYIYNGKKHKKMLRPFFRFYDANKTLINDLSMTITYSIKEIQVQPLNKQKAKPEYDPDMLLVYDNTLDEYCAECYSDAIPLGVYQVSDLKLEHTQSLIKQTVTAYDKIVKLEQNAANWYTQYMFGISFDEYYSQVDRIQFPRQIYATYFNYMNAVGIESRGTETQIASYVRNDLTVNANYYITWNPEEEGSVYDAQYRRLAYYKVNVPNVDSSKMYVIYTTNKNGMTNEEMLNNEDYVTNQYKLKVDELGRGITTGSILVEALNDSNVVIGSYCFDSGDYFTLPSGTTSFNIYIRAGLVNVYGDVSDITGHEMLETMKVYSTNKTADLVNKSERLVYYNMGTGDIYPTDSSATGRDVIRSILELCGCFFRLNRYDGLPEFVYCTKGGLYPRNDLYPADDLYPRTGTDQLLPNGRYMSVVQDNYSVKDFGCIQIVIDKRSNETKSVCEYQYPLNPTSQNAYVIKDNIFLCAEEATYDIDVLNSIFRPMYLQISNMGYVPNVTEAIGMPWVECGDRIGILTFTSGFESFVFRRTLKGIQLLIDTYESTGDEYTEAVKEFGYEVV